MTMDDAASGKGGATLAELPTPRQRERADLRRRPDRTAIVVAGMHRSGTSALTRVFSLLGCDLPKTLMGGGVGNEVGHWESEPIALFNDQLLESAGSSWDDWLPINPGWYRSPKAEDYKVKAIDVLKSEFEGSRLFVFKDPRICRLLSFWLDVIEATGIEPALVLPVRNPLEVSASLQSRDGFDPGLGQLIWLRHVLDAEAATRGRQRLYCSYNDLLGDWLRLVARTEETLGVSFPRSLLSAEDEVNAFLAERHRHHHKSRQSVVESVVLSAWLRDAYRVFDAWCAGGERTEDYATLDKISREFSAAAPAFAKVVQAGQRAAQRARTLEQDGARIADERDHAVEAAAQMRAQLADAEARLTTVSVARDALAQEMAAERAVWSEAAANFAEQIQGLQNEIEARAGALSAKERELAAVSAERDRTVAALVQARAHAAESDARSSEAIEDLKGEAAARQSLLQSKEREFAAVAAERDATVRALEQARAQAAQSDTRQSEQFLRLLDEARKLERELRAQVERRDSRLQERTIEIATLSRLLREQEEAARTASGDAASLREQSNRAAAEEAQRTQAAQEALAAAEQRADAAERALVDVREELARTAARLDERFREIAMLTRLLRDQERTTRAASDESAWLRRVSATLLAGGESWRGRVFQMLPGFAIRAWVMRHLKRQGLFDGAAYLNANPDVARARANPLRHFIHFGMKEGRRKG